MIRAMATIGESIMEDHSGGGGQGGLEVNDSTRAGAEIQRLTGDKEFQVMLDTKGHPGHKAAVDRWLLLHQQAQPGKNVEP
jgi:hypothetical protein